nr:unnamed protein product [Callosobruchus chinensis]
MYVVVKRSTTTENSGGSGKPYATNHPYLDGVLPTNAKWDPTSPLSDKITLKDLARNDLEGNNENIVSNRIKKEYDYSINPENRFECDICNKSYKNKRHLYRHQKEECIGVEPKFKCEIARICLGGNITCLGICQIGMGLT